MNRYSKLWVVLSLSCHSISGSPVFWDSSSGHHDCLDSLARNSELINKRFVIFLPCMPNSWLPVLRYLDVMNISMRRVLQWNQHAVMSGWLWITSQLQTGHFCHSQENLTCNAALPASWLYSHSRQHLAEQTPSSEPPVVCIFPSLKLTQRFVKVPQNDCVLTVAVMWLI